MKKIYFLFIIMAVVVTLSGCDFLDSLTNESVVNEPFEVNESVDVNESFSLNDEEDEVDDIKTEESDSEGEVTDLLKKLMLAGNFQSEIKDSVFEWRTVGIEVNNISGKEVSANKLKAEEVEAIENYFKNNGYDMDIYNIADGTLSGLVGYQKDEIVCTLLSGFSGYEDLIGDEEIQDFTVKDIELNCGEFEDEEVDIEDEESAVDDEEEISDTEIYNVGVDEEFNIVLDANSSTGYTWMAEIDDIYLSQSDKRYDTAAEEGVVGAGGYETFSFKALQAGTTEVKFTYARPWESVMPAETKVFKVIIE